MWTSAFGCKCRTDDALRYIKIIQESNHSNPNIQFAYGDTRHYKAMQDFWRSRHLENMLSSGFYFISSALMLCDELHVYGFWPFKYVTTTNDGTVISAPKSFPYHYYDTVGWKGVHNMPREFKYLVGLHELGALQLHIGKCGEWMSRTKCFSCKVMDIDQVIHYVISTSYALVNFNHWLIYDGEWWLHGYCLCEWSTKSAAQDSMGSWPSLNFNPLRTTGQLVNIWMRYNLFN